MDVLNHTTNWNDLPNEIKLQIVKRSEKSSRLALRLCSISDMQLVDSVPFRKIHYLELKQDSTYFFICLRETFYGLEERLLFENFEEFQNEVFSILDNVDYIKSLYIILESKTYVLKLKHGTVCKTITVGKMILKTVNFLDILQNIDAYNLGSLTLEMYRLETTDAVYDTPQVKLSEELDISSGLIRDDQLMKLTSKVIKITSPKRLSNSGICNFIRKCAFNPDCKVVEFCYLSKETIDEVCKELFRSLGQDERTNLVMLPLSGLHTTIRKDRSSIVMYRFETDYIVPDPVKFRKFEFIGIKHDKYKCYLTVGKTNAIKCEWPDWLFERPRWTFDSREYFQEALIEGMATIDYIKRLEINFEHSYPGLRLVPVQSSKQKTVGHLKLEKCENAQERTIVDLLKQIEPGHLKCVILHGQKYCNSPFDTQQIIQADYVETTQPGFGDSQLLKLNATTVKVSHDDYSRRIGSVTTSGMNLFLKKCLLNLKTKNYRFELDINEDRKYNDFVWKLLEGLDIYILESAQSIRGTVCPTEVLVNSEWDDLKLKLTMKSRYVRGRRVKM